MSLLPSRYSIRAFFVGFILLCISLPGYAQSCASRDFSSFEDTILQAYISYYGRPADAAGMAFWAGRLESEGGNLNSIIQEFGNSAEYNSRFGGLDNATLVNNIFRQLFGRDADSEGLGFYVGELDAGNRTLESIALDVMFGAQNADQTTVNNRVSLSQFYVDGLEKGGFISFSAEQLSAFNALVTASQSSLDATCTSMGEDPIESEDITITVAVSSSSKFTTVQGVDSEESITIVETLDSNGQPEKIDEVVSRVSLNSTTASAAISLADNGQPVSIVQGDTRINVTYNNDNTITLSFIALPGGEQLLALTKPTDAAGLAQVMALFVSLQDSAARPSSRASIIPKRVSTTSDSREAIVADFGASATNFISCTVYNATKGVESIESILRDRDILGWEKEACLSIVNGQIKGISADNSLSSGIEITDVGELECSDNVVCVDEIEGKRDDNSSGIILPPTGLTATAGDAQVTLTWSEDDSDSYNLYFSTVGNASAGTVIVGVISPYTHSDLVNNETYSYVIKGVHSEQESEASSEVSATPMTAALPAVISSPDTGTLWISGLPATVEWSGFSGETINFWIYKNSSFVDIFDGPKSNTLNENSLERQLESSWGTGTGYQIKATDSDNVTVFSEEFEIKALVCSFQAELINLDGTDQLSVEVPAVFPLQSKLTLLSGDLGCADIPFSRNFSRSTSSVTAESLSPLDAGDNRWDFTAPEVSTDTTYTYKVTYTRTDNGAEISDTTTVTFIAPNDLKKNAAANILLDYLRSSDGPPPS